MHPWLQTPCTQLPLAQSEPTEQVWHRAVAPGVAQLHWLLVKLQVWLVPQSELSWHCEVQRPAVTSQELLAQSTLREQVPQMGAAQVQAWVCWSQANPGQSVSATHACRQRPPTQFPLAQSVGRVQVAQRAAVPVGATQLQLWLGSVQVPPGQSESTAQEPEQMPATMSQVLLAQALFAVHAAQAGAPHEHWPAPPPPPRLQVKPPQSVDDTQPAVQTLVCVSQLPEAQSLFAVQAAQTAAVPAATQLHWLVAMSQV